MKIRTFGTDKLSDLAEMLSSEKIVVKKTLLSPMDYFYVFYEDAEEQVAREKKELGKLNEVAQKLEENEDYGKLKNSTQRSLYLLSKYSVPSGQATKVIELVNMRRVLQAETEK